MENHDKSMGSKRGPHAIVLKEWISNEHTYNKYIGWLEVWYTSTLIALIVLSKGTTTLKCGILCL